MGAIIFWPIFKRLLLETVILTKAVVILLSLRAHQLHLVAKRLSTLLPQKAGDSESEAAEPQVKISVGNF